MKKTPLKRRTPLKAKTPLTAKKNPKTTKVSSKPRKSSQKPKISKLRASLWELCKQITRQRYQNDDGTWNCFTCGNKIYDKAQAQTGHFITSSTCSTELRYDLQNLRVQDYRCNINLSGNWLAYEKNLKEEIGEDAVEELKKRNERTKGLQYDRLWYEEKIKEYQQLIS